MINKMGVNISTEENQLFDAAKNKYGEDSQFIHTIQEMSELTKVITKNMLGQYSELNLCEEIAHVMFMCNQLTSMLNIEDGVNEEYESCYNNLIKLLNKMEETMKIDYKDIDGNSINSNTKYNDVVSKVSNITIVHENGDWHAIPDEVDDLDGALLSQVCGDLKPVIIKVKE